MYKAYKYRLYPTDFQRQQIDQTLNVCRLVYNMGLEIKITAWRSAGKNISAFDLSRQLPELREAFPFIASVPSNALQQKLNHLDLAFKSFFRGNGFPKFKSKRDSTQSFQCHNNIRRIDWIKSTLTITKIVDIPIVLSRRFEGKIKTVTISRQATNKYYASILVQTDEPLPVPGTKANGIGIDMGLKSFATLSNGQKIDLPQVLPLLEQRLVILQKRASNKKKGSKNRKKANLKVALLHEKISNIKSDFTHKLSTSIIGDNQTDTICIEDLAISNMVKNRNLAASISAASWGIFLRQLEYKAKWSGKNLIKINRFYPSSKTCSICGNRLVDMNLSMREWVCNNCGSTHDRDINAAINIRNSGMGNPGEPAELPTIVGTMKQEFEYSECQTEALKL